MHFIRKVRKIGGGNQKRRYNKLNDFWQGDSDYKINDKWE